MSEDQEVYRMCRALFSGRSKQLKKPAIRQTLINNQSALHHLFRRYGEIRLTAMIQSLLKAGAFESDRRAKAMFPELFQTTPQQDAQREASEADAAKSVADILGGMSHPEDMESAEPATPAEPVWGWEVPPVPVPDDELPIQDAAASETPLETNGIDEGILQIVACYMSTLTNSESLQRHLRHIPRSLLSIQHIFHSPLNMLFLRLPRGCSKNVASISQRSGSPTCSRIKAGNVRPPSS